MKLKKYQFMNKQASLTSSNLTVIYKDKKTEEEVKPIEGEEKPKEKI